MAAKTKLTLEQLELLKKIASKKDKLFGAPRYLAKDSDGELRSYVGREPVRGSNGFWGGGFDVVPYEDYTGVEAGILNFIQIEHELPFDIEKMIRTGYVRTTERNELLDVMDNRQLHEYAGSKEDIGIFINECLDDSQTTVIGRESDFFPHGVNAPVIFVNMPVNAEGLLRMVTRTYPMLIVIDVSRNEVAYEQMKSEIHGLNRMGHPVIVVK
ncbi:hypothetical protein ACTFR8_23175 [Bacillus cereus group sp. MYBK15-3]|uniref:hypothetical protein n=1 Tax=unclassified Bacillus cereus group TaxID=2750818 RepID=UPI003F7A3342